MEELWFIIQVVSLFYSVSEVNVLVPNGLRLVR